MKRLWRSWARSWVHHFMANCATLAVLTLCFSVLILGALGATNFARLMNIWSGHVEMIVYLRDNMSDDQRQKLEAEFMADPAVEHTEFVGKPQAAKSFQANMQRLGIKFSSDLFTAQDNPFPAYERVSFTPQHRTLEEMRRLANDWRQRPGVEDVSYGQEWLESYSRLLTIMRICGAAIGTVILLGAFFAITTSIQASIVARQDEIEILQLVGATRWMIRRPFLFEGGLQGLFAAILSLLLASVGFQLIVKELGQELPIPELVGSLQFFDYDLILTLIFAGVCLGLLGSMISLRRLCFGNEGG